ncbi:MAG: ABC transporter permease [Betaproteobacteria bacterium]|nr:ABC transporter permease [Betaproteobacteria bacterium]
MTLAAPILIAAFFGLVLGDPQRKPARVPIAIADLDGSAVSARIVEAMRADPAVAVEVVAEPAAIELVRNGKVRALAVIPAGFGAAAARALLLPGAIKPEVAIHYDPSQAIAVSLIKGVLAEAGDEGGHAGRVLAGDRGADHRRDPRVGAEERAARRVAAA